MRASTCTRWGAFGDGAAELTRVRRREKFGPLGRRLIATIGAGGLHAALARPWRGVARERAEPQEAQLNWGH